MTAQQLGSNWDFLAEGGEMGERIRGHDWSRSPLGPRNGWPASLIGALRLVVPNPIPMYVAWGPELILLHNDGYARILGNKHPGALGQPLREVWHDIGPGIRQALQGKPAFEREVSRTVDRGDGPTIAYFTHSKIPLYDDAGHIIGVVSTVWEDTAEVRTRKTYKAESERLRELFTKAPGFMAVLRGPSHVFEVVNDAFYRLVGFRDVIGKPVREAIGEVAGQGYVELLDNVYATGEPYLASGAQVFLNRAPDQSPERRSVDFVYQPILDSDGNVSGIFVQGTDTTDSMRADDRSKEMERLAHSTIDALGEHIAVVDGSGAILAVNAAWREFAASNGAAPAAVSEGSNYLVACDRAAQRGDRDAAAVANLLRDVAAGARANAAMEYACNSPTEDRRFLLKISRFKSDGPIRIVVSHENITDRKNSEERLAYLATHDALTGLPNRAVLEDRTQQAIAHAQRRGRGVALCFLDLDNFKHFNDAYGHSIGDAILSAVAGEVRTLVPTSDTVARLGGDEFVVLLTDLDDAAGDAAKIAMAVLRRLGSPLVLDGREIAVTASIGVSTYPTDGTSLDELLKAADTAMYHAKSVGRSAFQFYSADMSARATERVVIEAELRRALRRERFLDQFEVHYQPQVVMRTREIVGVEALVRWSHPDLGTVSPARFIPIAEEAGLIGALGRWVLATACRQNLAWQRLGLAVPVAVNVSASQLRHPDFVNSVGDVLAETGLDPNLLELEITEGVMMERSDSTIKRLQNLKRLGVRLSIDDFGTGYSSLSYLSSFPFDRLKIDRSFVSGLPDDRKAASIARAILAMGRNLGLAVIAEGIETEAQAKMLKRMGCTQGQGFYYGTPLRPTEFEARLGEDLRLRKEGDRNSIARLETRLRKVSG